MEFWTSSEILKSMQCSEVVVLIGKILFRDALQVLLMTTHLKYKILKQNPNWCLCNNITMSIISLNFLHTNKISNNRTSAKT